MKILAGNKSKMFILTIILPILLSGQNKTDLFLSFITAFHEKYIQMNIPSFEYDYRNYFNSISSMENLNNQEEFFIGVKSDLYGYSKDMLKSEERIIYDHLDYEIKFNLQRISLEKLWVKDGRKIPVAGLYELENRQSWYDYFIKKFTGLNITPEEVLQTGLQEVSKIKKEMDKIRIELGFSDSNVFYKYLQSDTFFIRDKQELFKAFNQADSAIIKNLPAFIGDIEIPKVYPMEWNDAGPNTPPGIYLNHTDNPYNQDVFLFNFYGNKYNSRAVDWLYMHEAIPGHHLQYSLRNKDKTDSLQNIFSYSGNFEGWACYVEYVGKELGLYKDSYSYLGKWEWDLARSARLVIDAGIHYYGWTKEQALAYWKKNIPGQVEIAEREVTRVTNWPAQALSYKTGSACIMQLKESMQKKYGYKFDVIKFHLCYLSFGMRPLEVVKNNFEIAYENFNK